MRMAKDGNSAWREAGEFIPQKIFCAVFTWRKEWQA
jgi:hypothetical protein